MHPVDLAIIVVYLAAMPVVGVLAGRRQRSAADYFIGERSLPWWAVCFSIVATETSTLTVISTPGLIWAASGSYNGLTYLQLPFGYIIGRTLVSFVLLPRYFKGKQSTAYAFLGERFGSTMQGVSSVAFIVTRLLAEGVRLFAGAIPIQLILSHYGLHTQYWHIVVVLTALTVIYALVGGIKAVVWVDVIQLSVYVGAAIVAAIVLATKLPSGWASRASEAGIFRVFDFNFSGLHLLTNQYAFLTAVVGGAIFTMASHGSDQLIVQRFLSCRSIADGRKALIGSGLVVTVQFALFLFIGAMLWAHNGFRTLTELHAKSSDDVFTNFITSELPVGVAGLLIAAILASTMGALASALNALSNSTVADLYQRFTKRKPEDSKVLRHGRVWTLVWAVVFAVFGSLFSSRNNPVIEQGLSITGYTYGAMLGAFFLGMWVKKARQLDAIIAFGVTVAVMAVVVLGVKIPPAPGAKPVVLAFPWYTLLGVLITLFVGGALSLRHRTRDPRVEQPGELERTGA
ncbi:sodium:solute symporter [Amycolatopsis alkalitolerans]|uniref:Sodium:solute symporter n=1 Tax=Amycolatopsis alkalitolerans TaxID=2547244 RepID=A0A5C4LVY8_9PSEU|nr:sodium:solute symporter [Amycolatopsis alkalitolerans]TNC22469.1 sodium:solute symporter [Amycolatopsis alkalitolerans]